MILTQVQTKAVYNMDIISKNNYQDTWNMHVTLVTPYNMQACVFLYPYLSE